MDLPYGVPYTLDQAYPFVQNATIALGFPDITCEPEDLIKTVMATSNNFKKFHHNND